MKQIITLLIMLTSFTFAEADSGYQKEIDQFFEFLEKGKTSEAVESIYRTNTKKNVNKKKDVFKNRIDNLSDEAGDYCGYAYVTETRITDHFIHVIYLAFYEKEPFRVGFKFYKPKDKWITYSFTFDFKLDEYTEEITKEKFILSDDK